MPNWCYCELSVVGPIEERIRFKEFAKGNRPVLDFDVFIPYPEPYRTMDETSREMRDAGVPWKEIPKDGFNSGGYEWCIANWGTKWNASHAGDIIEKPRSLLYKFSTAWSPPIPVVHAMTEIFPNLRFNLRFREEGMGFRGQLMIKNGITLKDW